MFTIERCRKIDPELQGLTDEEVVVLRDDMIEIAELAFQQWLNNGSGSKNPERVWTHLRVGVS